MPRASGLDACRSSQLDPYQQAATLSETLLPRLPIRACQLNDSSDVDWYQEAFEAEEPAPKNAADPQADLHTRQPTSPRS